MKGGLTNNSDHFLTNGDIEAFIIIKKILNAGKDNAYSESFKYDERLFN